MKKQLFIMVALLAVPAIADITITATENGDGRTTITMDVTDNSVVRGVALNVACTNGASLVDLSYTTDAGLNTFIDYLFANPGTTFSADTPAQEGHPYADAAAPGEAAIGATDFSICAGVLDATGNQAGLGAGTYTVAIINTGAGDVCISADALRGGIVGDNLGVVDTEDCVIPEKYCRVMFDAATQAYYDSYAIKPTAWCDQYQCRGDADQSCELVFLQGTFRIYNDDLTMLINNWKRTPATANPAADFDHASETVFLQGVFAIYNNDLTILINNWAKTDAQLADCPSYMP